jgi:hypothetical protein
MRRGAVAVVGLAVACGAGRAPDRGPESFAIAPSSSATGSNARPDATRAPPREPTVLASGEDLEADALATSQGYLFFGKGKDLVRVPHLGGAVERVLASPGADVGLCDVGVEAGTGRIAADFASFTAQAAQGTAPRRVIVTVAPDGSGAAVRHQGSEYVHPKSLSAGPTGAAFTEVVPGDTGGIEERIQWVDESGAPARELVPVTPGLLTMAADADGVTYVDKLGSAVRRAPLSAGSPETLWSYTGHGRAHVEEAIAVDADGVYVAVEPRALTPERARSMEGLVLARIPRGGGAPVSLAVLAKGHEGRSVGRIVADDAAVFVTLRSTTLQPNTGSIVRVAKDGSSAAPVVAQRAGPLALAVGDDWLAWIEAGTGEPGSVPTLYVVAKPR